MRRALLATALLLTLATSLRAANPPANPTTPPTTYPINLLEKDLASAPRDLHVIFDQRIESNLLTTTPPTAVLPPQILQADLTGKIEALKLNPSGIATDLRLTVAKMSRPDGKDLLKPGLIIDIHRTPQTCSFKPTGGTLTAPAKSALDLIFPNLPQADQNQLVFGTSTRAAIGASWDIDRDHAVDLFDSSGVSVAPKDVSGSATLKEKTTLAGIPALRYELFLKGANVHYPDDPPVPGSTFTQAITLVQPLDPALPRLQCDNTLDLDLRTQNRRGQNLQTKLHVSIQLTSTPSTSQSTATAAPSH